jgi:hypothetical protein
LTYNHDWDNPEVKDKYGPSTIYAVRDANSVFDYVVGQQTLKQVEGTEKSKVENLASDAIVAAKQEALTTWLKIAREYLDRSRTDKAIPVDPKDEKPHYLEQRAKKGSKTAKQLSHAGGTQKGSHHDSGGHHRSHGQGQDAEQTAGGQHHYGEQHEPNRDQTTGHHQHHHGSDHVHHRQDHHHSQEHHGGQDSHGEKQQTSVPEDRPNPLGGPSTQTSGSQTQFLQVSQTCAKGPKTPAPGMK